MTAAAFLARHLLFLAAITSASWAIGTGLARRLPTASSLERHAVATTLGLALLGHLAFALGLVGWLAPIPLILATALLSLPAVHHARGGTGRGSPLRPLAMALLLLVTAPFFLLALYPPTAFDATTYHLPMARAFAQTGALPFLPTLRVPVFPALSELLSAVALLFAGDVATHLVQLLATALTAALLVVWGKSHGSFAAGAIAGAIFLGNPIVAHLAGIAYVDMLLALFVTAALFAAERWRASGHRGWLAAAALFAGSAAAVKYFGLFFVAWVGIEALRQAGRGRRVKAAAVYAVAALATLLPTYARIAVHTGDPIFPFASAVFGESPWSGRTTPVPVQLTPEELASRYARLPLLPWDLVFERERTNRQPPFSPAFLLALPALAWGVARERRVRRLLLPAAVYLAVFPLLPPDARYLVPVLPLVSLATALSLPPLLARLPERRRTVAVVLLAIACLLPGWLYAFWRLDRQGPPPATAAARDAYLSGALPGYRALRFLNRTHGPLSTVYGLHAENHAYFAEGRFLGDWVGPYAFAEVIPLLADPAALHARLRTFGATHLLLVRGKDDGLRADPGFRRFFLEVYADRHARLFRLAGG